MADATPAVAVVATRGLRAAGPLLWGPPREPAVVPAPPRALRFSTVSGEPVVLPLLPASAAVPTRRSSLHFLFVVVQLKRTTFEVSLTGPVLAKPSSVRVLGLRADAVVSPAAVLGLFPALVAA